MAFAQSCLLTNEYTHTHTHTHTRRENVTSLAKDEVRTVWSYRNSVIIFYTLGIKDPEGFGKKENCRSDHYSRTVLKHKGIVAARRLSLLARKRAGTKKLSRSRSSPE